MNLLIPGRHHLLTDFQFKYLYRIITSGLSDEPDVNGNPLGITGKVENVIFAVTSANHSNTRRNPVPFHLRAMALLDFSQELEIPTYVFGIDDVGYLKDFAGYTLKTIHHESDGRIDLNPENTVVACSTPVMEMYEKRGFRILPVELENREVWTNLTLQPWELVEKIAACEGEWSKDRMIFNHMHQASYLIWSRYALGAKVQLLFSDDMIGADGDLTESRDYTTYVKAMDATAELKYRETAPYIQPGRIGEIGCAVGSWIQLACKEPRFHESDFIGIEVARALYRICLQRKENGDFANPYVFFAQKNAVTSLCFERNSMNTLHTSSLTHEIESYGDREDLLKFIQNRYEELVPGGVWVNRDVVGPENGDQTILLWVNPEDGKDEPWDRQFMKENGQEKDREAQSEYLKALSTRNRFQRFVQDFRKGDTGQLSFQWKTVNGTEYAEMTLRDAMEFISKKDYTLNWDSEMHERFCFWSYSDWQTELEKVGFHLDPNSHTYTNTWLVENRYRGSAELFELRDGKADPIPYPVTHLIMVAEKRF